MLFYTDGITEARTPEGDFFGVDRLVDLTDRLAGAADQLDDLSLVLRREEPAWS